MTAETILQTVGGILITICLGLVGWCLKQLVALKERVAMHQATNEARHDEYERRFNELRSENNRLNKEHVDAIKQLGLELRDTNRHVKSVDDKINQVSQDIAVIKAKAEPNL